MRISDWSSDVCSSDLPRRITGGTLRPAPDAGLRPRAAGMKALAFAWRRLRRGWRSGELLIVALALAIAVAATGAVHLFTERVRIAISEQSGDTLGADLVYRARDPLPAALRERIANKSEERRVGKECVSTC